MHGTIHSYSYRLYGWDERLWQHAWVNRIALFLREWAAQINNTQADELLGRLSKAEILMTHDVDAINKTLPIRIKQGAFNLFNVIRHVRRGELIKAKAKMTIALRFLLGQENWWTLDQLLKIEQQHNIRARYHFMRIRNAKNHSNAGSLILAIELILKE